MTALTKTALVCAFAIGAQSAFCQSYGAVSSRKDGTGTFYSYGNSFRADFLTVDLSPGGRATIKTWHSTIYGHWRNAGNRDELTIDGIRGGSDERDRASGNGYVTLGRGGDWTRVYINAWNQTDHSKIALDFSAYQNRRYNRNRWYRPNNRRFGTGYRS